MGGASDLKLAAALLGKTQDWW